MKALAIAATGMNAQQTNLEVIANNIANINTTGYKRARAEFSVLLYQVDRTHDVPNLVRELGGITHLLTCGSVDDGKSTLIGRLLWDASDLYEDQRENVRRSGRKAAGTDLPDGRGGP